MGLRFIMYTQQNVQGQELITPCVSNCLISIFYYYYEILPPFKNHREPWTTLPCCTWEHWKFWNYDQVEVYKCWTRIYQHKECWYLDGSPFFGAIHLQWSYPPCTKYFPICLQMSLGTYARAYCIKEYKRDCHFLIHW